MNRSPARRLRILYCAYGSGFFRPHLHSQILPHIERLSQKGHHFRVLTSEPEHPSELEQQHLQEAAIRLNRAGAQWQALSTCGFIDAARQISQSLLQLPPDLFPEVLHARGIASGIIISRLAARMERPWVFDPRVVFSEVGIDTARSRTLAGRARRFLFRHVDWILALKADVVRLESRQHRDWYLKAIPPGLHSKLKVFLDRNSVDTRHFRFDPAARDRVRRRLGLNGQRLVVVYSGSVVGNRNLAEMCRFLLHLTEQRCFPFFLILTHHPLHQVQQKVGEYGLGSRDFHVTCAPHSEMPALLSAADAAVVFHKSTAWNFSFPLKLGEYLSVGLPVVLNHGFGGAGRFIRSNRAGIVLQDLGAGELNRGALELKTSLRDSTFSRCHCRRVARTFLSVERSAARLERLYRSLT